MVADFGTAAAIGRAKIVGGTYEYLAPEALAGATLANVESVLARETQDAYALGVTAYQVVTRDHRPPFEMERIEKHQDRLLHANDAVDDELEGRKREQSHQAMDVKTGPSLLETILDPEVFTPPSPLRYGDHVRNVLASLLCKDPDHRMSIRELRDFALVGQLWESEASQGQEDRHGPLPFATVADLVDLEAKGKQEETAQGPAHAAGRETGQGPAVSGAQADLEPPTDGANARRMARGVSMKPCATAKMGVSPRRVTQQLCPKEVHELLTAVAHSPTGVLLEVGYLVRLSEALVTVALSTSGRVGGSGDRGGRAAVPEASRRVIRTGAPAARRRSSMTAENREEAVAFSSSAKKQMKKAMRSDAPSAKGRKGATMKRNGGLERAKQAQHLKSWAAKAKRSVSSLVERLESARTEVGVEDAKLVILHAKDIPEEKAERVTIVAAQVVFVWGDIVLGAGVAQNRHRSSL
eukprot:g16846.t1